jgi:hypothetical protein
MGKFDFRHCDFGYNESSPNSNKTRKDRRKKYMVEHKSKAIKINYYNIKKSRWMPDAYLFAVDVFIAQNPGTLLEKCIA